MSERIESSVEELDCCNDPYFFYKKYPVFMHKFVVVKFTFKPTYSSDESCDCCGESANYLCSSEESTDYKWPLCKKCVMQTYGGPISEMKFYLSNQVSGCYCRFCDAEVNTIEEGWLLVPERASPPLHVCNSCLEQRNWFQ